MIDFLVNIDVPEIEAATAFYTQALGLIAGRRFGDGGIELLGAGAPVYLLAKPEGNLATRGSRDKRTYGRHWTPVHLDFVVANIDAAVARAVAAGAIVESPGRRSQMGKDRHARRPIRPRHLPYTVPRPRLRRNRHRRGLLAY
jgi:catechol 2,3-dioxygenase-like lactoylglutathione lyase family enzyme